MKVRAQSFDNKDRARGWGLFQETDRSIVAISRFRRSSDHASLDRHAAMIVLVAGVNQKSVHGFVIKQFLNVGIRQPDGYSNASPATAGTVERRSASIPVPTCRGEQTIALPTD